MPRFSSDGSALGGEFQLNTITSGFQNAAVVAWMPGGDFIAAWDDGSDIKAQRFAADAVPVASEFQLNTNTDNTTQNIPEISIDAEGDYVAAWVAGFSDGTDTSGNSVQAVVRSFSELVFADGFESGDLTAWFSSSGVLE